MIQVDTQARERNRSSGGMFYKRNTIWEVLCEKVVILSNWSSVNSSRITVSNDSFSNYILILTLHWHAVMHIEIAPHDIRRGTST